MVALKDRIVVLIANQRSGTNLLREVLDSSGQFLNVGELFEGVFASEGAVTPPGYRFDLAALNFFRFRARQFRSKPELSVPIDRNMRQLFIEFLSFVVDQFATEKRLILDVKYNSTGHFDLIWHHRTERPYLLDLLREFEIPIIHLKRVGLLNVIVSEIVADANQRWELRAGKPPPTFVPVNVNPIEVEHRIRDLRWESQRFVQWLWQYRGLAEVWYENMVAGDESFDSKVAAPIGSICASTLEPGLWSRYLESENSLRKVISSPFAAVENMAEVQAHLLTTDLAGYVRGKPQ